MSIFREWLKVRDGEYIDVSTLDGRRYHTGGYIEPGPAYAISHVRDWGCPVWEGLESVISEWPSPCPTCGATDCPNLKNSAAMCPGPAP